MDNDNKADTNIGTPRRAIHNTNQHPECVSVLCLQAVYIMIVNIISLVCAIASFSSLLYQSCVCRYYSVWLFFFNETLSSMVQANTHRLPQPHHRIRQYSFALFESVACHRMYTTKLETVTLTLEHFLYTFIHL